MKRFYDNSIFIIEGDNLYNTDSKIHPNAIKGALASLALGWHIPVLFSKDAMDTALLLWIIGNQDNRSVDELTNRPGRKPKRIYKICGLGRMIHAGENDFGHPINFINWCLEENRIASKDLDYKVFCEKPFI